MRKLLLVILAFLSCSHVYGQCNLSSGASTSAIQTAVNSMAAGTCPGPATHTLNFGAGSYSITSAINIPCPTAASVMQGTSLPSNVWPPAPTAIFTNNGITNDWGFHGGGSCANGVTIQYLEWNGNQPSGGGGGFLHIPLGMNNTTVQWNYLHGNMALQTAEQRPDIFVYLDGAYGSTHTQNTTIQFNQIGKTGSGDCGGNAPATTGKGVMSLMGSGGGPGTCYSTSPSGYAPPSGASNTAHTCLYQGQSNDNGGGGSCGAFGLATNTDNFKFLDNSVQEQEQGGKCFQNNNGTTFSTNTLIQLNDFSGIHRIGIEAQCNDGQFTVDSNDFHDPFQPNANSWAFSLPQGSTTSTNNVLIGNTPIQNDRNGNPASYAGAGIEFWGNQTSSQNLIQGLFSGGIQYGKSNNINTWSANNNNIQLTAYPGQCIVDEGYHTQAPAQSGNICSTTVAAVTSQAPTISPTPTGTYSSAIAVTITDAGFTSGAGSRGNTSIFYTTDGSTPTTASQWCASPCSISVSPGTTVNAIGMWGALNQPRSYPTGFGFKPSAVIGAHYSSGTTPTLTGVSLSLAGGVTTMQTGTSVQACATATYSGVSPVVTCGNGPDTYGTTFGTWTSSVSADAKISTAGLVQGVAAGSTNLAVTATQGITSFTASPFALTVTNPPPPSPYLGDPNFDTPGSTGTNYINATYAVTGTTTAGYNVQSCTFNLPTGTYSAGSKWDCGLVRAPTPTTQSSSWLCHAAYTNTGTSSDVGWHTLTMPGCGVLPPSTAYWIAVVTNGLGSPGQGFSTCGGGPCNGPAPTVGIGTYPCSFISATYGVYTGMGTAMHLGCGPSATVQASQYVTLGTPLPNLVSAFMANPGPTLIMSLGGSVQFSIFCGYDDGTFHLCFPAADQYGSTATGFSSDNTAAVTIGNVGSAHPGLATSVGLGSANISATVTGGVTTSPLWNLTVSSTPLPYPPSSPRGLSR